MGNEKIKVGIFDNDFKLRTIKNYEVSDDGTQIRIVSGGEGHWMPKFDNNSFLEFPSWKKYLIFGARSWKRLYFVKRKGEKCVDFHTGVTSGPSPEESKKAIGTTLLGKIGQDKLEIPLYISVILILNLVFSIIIMRVLGVF